MTDHGISEMIGPGGETWNLPTGESRRQAISSLRGYAYQLHRTVAAWLALEGRNYLFVEAAEDYATLGKSPGDLEEILAATQVKDTRESGAVTLNSADAIKAVVNLWRYQEANPGRNVSLTFLTTSPIGAEHKNRLANPHPGISLWQQISRGKPESVADLRAALRLRIAEPPALVAFLETSSDDDFVNRIIRPLTWSCGEPEYSDIVEQNREDLISLGVSLRGSPEQSERAIDTLLHTVLDTIINDPKRRLTRSQLLKIVEEANTVRVPVSRITNPGLDLEATGGWVSSENVLNTLVAERREATAAVAKILEPRGRLWLHGANGMGKSTLAALLARSQGGRWQVLRLRGASGPAVAERLEAARHALRRTPDLVGLILDDLPVAEESKYLVEMQSLGATLGREGLSCIVTSNRHPGSALREALGMSVEDLAEAQDFSDADAAQLVVSYGGNPATWSTFVRYAGGFGHPQLVHAVVAGVAARGWKEEELAVWIAQGFNTQDTSAERAAVRGRLLNELDAEKTTLLTRLARINGGFDRIVVDAVAAIEPVAPSARVDVEKLTGHWIERLGEDRIRVSPLIADLADHLVSKPQLLELDRAIGRSIVDRMPVEADLMDTGFLHALLAGDEETLARVAFLIMKAGKHTTAIASAMPMFRGYESGVRDTTVQLSAALAVMLALARHRLIVTRLRKPEINASIAYTLHLADVEDAEKNDLAKRSRFMALSGILGFEESMGLIDDWFSHLREIDGAERANPQWGNDDDQAAEPMGIAPMDFLFVAHAMHLPDTTSLAHLFDELADRPPEERVRWLAALRHEPGWLPLVVANAWLKDQQSEAFDWQAAAGQYATMGNMAVAWGETQLAARCFVAQSVLIDEYGNDAAAALEALAIAQASLPNNLDLVRERAKIAWRMGNYETALNDLASIEGWLEEGDAIEAAFAFREAAMSAGELGRYDDAHRYFLMAHAAAARVRSDQEAFKLGLLIDASGVKYMSGDQVGAIRDLVPVLEQLALIDSKSSERNHAVAVLARHFVLWLRAQTEPDVQVDGRDVHYFVGAISNPSPHHGLAEQPLPNSPAPMWFLFGLVALEEGIPWSELSSWSGIRDLKRFSDLYIQLPLMRLGRSVAAGDLLEFAAAGPEAMAAIRFFHQARARDPYPDPLNPAELSLDAFADSDTGSPPTDLIKDVAIGLALKSFVAHGNIDFAEIAAAANLAAGQEILSEWSGSSSNQDDVRSATALAVMDLVNQSARTLGQEFVLQLRLWEWLQRTQLRRELAPSLAVYVRNFWLAAVAERRFELSMPAVTVPPIENLLAGFQETNNWLASMLLAARDAVAVGIAADFREMLVSASRL